MCCKRRKLVCVISNNRPGMNLTSCTANLVLPHSFHVIKNWRYIAMPEAVHAALGWEYSLARIRNTNIWQRTRSNKAVGYQ
jgi:hypothetical protein